MQISRIILINYQQFDFLDVDLSYPKDHTKEGKPLEKICFIGKNGTGKTTLIELINIFLINQQLQFGGNKGAIKIRINERDFYVLKSTEPGSPGTGYAYYDSSLEKEIEWVNDLKSLSPSIFNAKYIQYQLIRENLTEFLNAVNDKSQRLLIYAPSEAHANELLNIADLPQTNLNNALGYFKDFPYPNNISFQNVTGFWNTIIYQIKKRENDYLEFIHLEENKTKAISNVENEFNRRNPFFLNRLSEIWNRILDKAGLYFDVEQAKIPMQLTENLQVYIKLKSTNQKISYSRLSSGIRHYIFRLGYIASLYYNRKVKSAVALIDEPENSLFPDLLYDLVDQYLQVTRRTQIYFATHSPIIASQFEPCERIILDFDENGKSISRKGKAAIGDEPNDILLQDFGIESLLGKEGIKKWERYVKLKILIRQEKNEAQKEAFVKEFLEIGKAYNF